MSPEGIGTAQREFEETLERERPLLSNTSVEWDIIEKAQDALAELHGELADRLGDIRCFHYRLRKAERLLRRAWDEPDGIAIAAAAVEIKAVMARCAAVLKLKAEERGP